MTIEELMRKVPRTVLIFGAFVIAVIYLVTTQPPRTKCDTEGETFRQRLIGIVVPRTDEKKGEIPASLARNKRECQFGNGAGACYPYFSDLRKILNALQLASDECRADFSLAEDVRAVLSDGLEVMVRIAWGEEPGENDSIQKAWFQDPELSLFCNLHRFIRQNWEEEDYVGLQGAVLSRLPGKKIPIESQVATEGPPSALSLMPHEEVLRRSLFKFNCSQY
jgi:hypothetical protein